MEHTTTKRPVRVGLISLGCAKNLVDAEIMLGSLLGAGMEIINDPKQADAVIVNTCSFIDSAQEESVDTILQSAQLRDACNPNQALIVSGCLPQRFREELPKLLPEVDAFIGIDQVAQVSTVINEALAHRARRIMQAPKKGGRRKTITGRLAELDAAQPKPTGSEPDSLRGTGKLNKTRTMVTPPPAPVSEGPVFDVTARPTFIPDFQTPRFRLTPKQFAFVKIAVGVNNPC